MGFRAEGLGWGVLIMVEVLGYRVWGLGLYQVFGYRA